MCLGMPGQVLEVRSNSNEATVDFWGIRKTVSLDDLEEKVPVGAYIIDHGGRAVRVIPPRDVQDTLALYEVLLSEAGEDPLVQDVCEALG